MNWADYARKARERAALAAEQLTAMIRNGEDVQSERFDAQHRALENYLWNVSIWDDMGKEGCG